jgi:hypothetical protein
VAAAVAALLAALGLAAALGAFSGGREAAQRHGGVGARPPGPPPADSTAGTVRCSASACAQLGKRVVPPIEGSPCRPQGRAGKWERIDADGQNPLFGCTPAQSPPPRAVAPATVPDLGGARLDYAERLLDRLGVHHGTSGGGVFGIVDRGNWTVCTTKPGYREPLARDASVKLFVDRSC